MFNDKTIAIPVFMAAGLLTASMACQPVQAHADDGDLPRGHWTYKTQTTSKATTLPPQNPRTALAATAAMLTGGQGKQKTNKTTKKPKGASWKNLVTAHSALCSWWPAKKAGWRKNYYADCGAFVQLAVWASGIDDAYPAGGLRAQKKYLKNSSKWKNVGKFDRKKGKGIKLVPGDILIHIYSKSKSGSAGHVLIYTGNDVMVKRYGSKSKAIWAEAGRKSYWPSATTIKRKDSRTFTVYRYQGNKAPSGKFANLLASEKEKLAPYVQKASSAALVKDQYVYDDYYINYHNVLGGEANEPKLSTYKYDSPTITLPNPIAVKGYRFTGWKDEDGKVWTKIPRHSSQDIDLYANYEQETYSIAFDANGGSGSMKTQTVKYGERVALPKNIFTRSGFQFVGWATSKNTSKASYMNCATVKNLADAGKTATLYALWTSTAKSLSAAQVQRYTVAFNPNGGTGKMASTTADVGTAVKLPANAFVRQGYTFTGWNTKTDGRGMPYADKGKVSYQKQGTLTLYAQWKANAPSDASSTAKAAEPATDVAATVSNGHMIETEEPRVVEKKVSCYFDGVEFTGFDTSIHSYELNTKFPRKLKMRTEDGSWNPKLLSISKKVLNLENATYSRSITVRGGNSEIYTFTWTWPVP